MTERLELIKELRAARAERQHLFEVMEAAIQVRRSELGRLELERDRLRNWLDSIAWVINGLEEQQT